MFDCSSESLTDIIGCLTSLAQGVVPVLISLALLFFFWGLAQWILNVSDSDKHKEGKERMIWGLVALFFIVSIAGLVSILQATFFSSNSLHDTTFGDVNRFGTSGANPSGSLYGDAPSGGGSSFTPGSSDSIHFVANDSGSSGNRGVGVFGGIGNTFRGLLDRF